MQYAKYGIAPIAPKPLALGHGREASDFVTIPQYESTRLEGWLRGIRTRNSAPLHQWMADTVFEPEWLLLGRKDVTVLTPDGFNPWQPLISIPAPLERALKPLRVWSEGDRKSTRLNSSHT